MKIVSVVGARPNFMKVAPIAVELAKHRDRFDHSIVHTGQHYDEQLSRVFFDELGIPRPDVNLNVGSGSHAQQTAAIISAFEPVLTSGRPDLVVVVGDVNSTIACALVASKLGIAVAHVEAGLRSFDRTMPEEINRVLTDQISDILFTTEPVAADNLRREGIADDKIHFVGNVMIDTLLAHRDRARALDVPTRLGLAPKSYGILTLHRPSNVDNPEVFKRLFSAIGEIAAEYPIVFPVHPRTRHVLKSSDATTSLVSNGRLRLLEPLGYLDFMGLQAAAKFALTDSGGVQEETTILGVPCLTLRENTERIVTATHGTNRVVGTDPQAILAAWSALKANPVPTVRPPLWDGQAAARLVDVLVARYNSRY